MPSVSLVVLHHDKAPYSRACLDSLLSSTGRPLQIINVDNGSRDDTPLVLDEWESKAQAVGIETVRLRYEEISAPFEGATRR